MVKSIPGWAPAVWICKPVPFQEYTASFPVCNSILGRAWHSKRRWEPESLKAVCFAALWGVVYLRYHSDSSFIWTWDWRSMQVAWLMWQDSESAFVMQVIHRDLKLENILLKGNLLTYFRSSTEKTASLYWWARKLEDSRSDSASSGIRFCCTTSHCTWLGYHKINYHLYMLCTQGCFATDQAKDVGIESLAQVEIGKETASDTETDSGTVAKLQMIWCRGDWRKGSLSCGFWHVLFTSLQPFEERQRFLYEKWQVSFETHSHLEKSQFSGDILCALSQTICIWRQLKLVSFPKNECCRMTQQSLKQLPWYSGIRVQALIDPTSHICIGNKSLIAGWSQQALQKKEERLGALCHWILINHWEKHCWILKSVCKLLPLAQDILETHLFWLSHSPSWASISMIIFSCVSDLGLISRCPLGSLHLSVHHNLALTQCSPRECWSNLALQHSHHESTRSTLSLYNHILALGSHWFFRPKEDHSLSTAFKAIYFKTWIMAIILSTFSRPDYRCVQRGAPHWSERCPWLDRADR